MKTFYKINTDGTLQLGSGTVIPQGFTEYTKGNEPQELLAALQFMSDQVALAKFKLDIKKALSDTDKTIMRINQGVILGSCSYSNSDVVAFVTYIKDLRALLSSSTIQALPTKPPYPKGT